ncbi:rhodanese-like domain-containing protein [Azovibrio restrictus]|uniref:rhodanese-like domain-containing protein n=1 Tax=Azovibrio restrictus TaxID=146938 RepID=UPI000405EACA|nr:rhodanese-like domain-containing protein [Azovibrio restrictus]
MQKTIRTLTAVLLLACSPLAFAQWAPESTDWSKLPDIKVSKLGLYLTPQQAFAMKQKEGNKVALFDIRTRYEAMYVGMATAADALIPFVEHQELMQEWDDKRHMYKVEPFQDFVPELERRLAELGLQGKDVPILLICRSGDRSSKAADRLMAAGYTRVYSVAEGFEGDTAKEGPQAGQRVVNGWKNAGLPWTYKLDKAKMYFPR